MDSLYMGLALAEAEKYIGATAPNPPVGACLVRDDRVLAVGAHKRAGTEHAEAAAIRQATEKYGSEAVRGASLYVTLEPCNHTGRTPPCTDAIFRAGIRRVFFGARDPNKNVAGGGANALRRLGLSVISGLDEAACRKILAPFAKHSATGLPWVVHKLAYRIAEDGIPTLMPEPGQKTFTSEESLTLAHIERRSSDAILTGIGTVLADQPLFSVRHIADHAYKERYLAVVSGLGRLAPEAWVRRQSEIGFEVLEFRDPLAALQELGKRGALRVLAECGPGLSKTLIEHRLWDERLTFIHRPGRPDFAHRELAIDETEK